MNLKAAIITTACSAFLVFAYGKYNYLQGWNEGRANLVSQQQQKAQAELAKKTQRQQQDESKAAAADSKGKTESEVITREVVKYIRTPGRNVCTFDEARVKLKQAAVDNTNNIEGYDHE